VSGVYLHIPFCKQACSYCDFHFSTNWESRDRMVTSMLREMELRHPYLEERRLESIYFGGGTPSVLSPENLSDLLEGLARYFSWGPEAEITLEANPEDIGTDTLNAWKQAGINRLSIGLQSFDDRELKWMNRTHTAAGSEASVKLAQDTGFHNITVDLIYGSKFQTLESWENTLGKVIALGTPHISSYNLTIEQQTALGVNYRRGKEPAVSDELSGAQFLLMSDRLSQAGFQHYEISNFARPGFLARHNSNYWRQQHYLGLGPSAHSFNGRSRQWNLKNNARYMQALETGGEFFEKEDLSLADRYNEYILTRLRTVWGCDLREISELFGKEYVLHFQREVLQKSDVLEERAGVYTLKPQARLLADGIASDLFI
jgi:oxygen-independent coproporphyrinogen-3 oxidase